MNEKYYLIDLERSLKTGKLFFWMPNERGYTNSLDDAGEYGHTASRYICEQDLNKNTVRIEAEKSRKLWSGQL